MERLAGLLPCFTWTVSVTLGKRPNHGLGAHDTVRLVESMDSRDRNCLVSLPSGKMKYFWVGIKGILHTPRKKNQVLGTVVTKP